VGGEGGGLHGARSRDRVERMINISRL